MFCKQKAKSKNSTVVPFYQFFEILLFTNFLPMSVLKGWWRPLPVLQMQWGKLDDLHSGSQMPVDDD